MQVPKDLYIQTSALGGGDRVYYEESHGITRERFVCVINESQLDLIQNAYPTQVTRYDANDGHYSVIKITNIKPNETKKLKKIVGPVANAQCKHATVKGFYYLFTIPSLS